MGLSRILEELSNQYILGYESKNTARNGTWREVKLRFPAPTERSFVGLSRSRVVTCVIYSSPRP